MVVGSEEHLSAATRLCNSAPPPGPQIDQILEDRQRSFAPLVSFKTLSDSIRILTASGATEPSGGGSCGQ